MQKVLERERISPLTRLASLVFWAFVVFISAFMFVGATIIFVLSAPLDKKRRILHLYSCFWGQILFYTNPVWRIRIEGRNRIPWNGPAVIVSNHQSLADIPLLFGLYRPFKWVSKAEVFRVPILGWNMRFNRYIPLIRGDKDSIEEMMDQCRYWLKEGVPVLMFPEGTRSRDGNLLPFKDGAFRLAIESDCPVIPIALTGTAPVLPKHGFVIRHRADCKVRVLESVHPHDFDYNVDAFRDYIREQIDKERISLEE